MRQRRDGQDGGARWPIWALPRSVLVVILLVELMAVVTLAAAAASSGIGTLPPAWPVTLAVLVLSGVATTEASLGVERIRRQSAETPHIDLSSVWAFAAAVLLPAVLACVVVVVIYAYMFVRVWRRHGVPPHRVLFSTATVILAVEAAAAVIDHLGGSEPFHSAAGLVSLLVAVLAYAVVNMVLIVTVIVLSGTSRSMSTFLHVLGDGEDAVLELATLSMGALAAGAMASFGDAYALLALPPLIVLHRTVLVRQLEEAASIDGKTNLLNAAAWHLQADRLLRRIVRAGGTATVLVLDLDHFKLVNDLHGHLVGDEVLTAVAGAIRDEVRDDDLVGRFGGEEFIVLLPSLEDDPGRLRAEAAADRIRCRIAELEVEVPGPYGDLVVVGGLSVSVGGATSPADGTDLAELVELADSAMYVAKDAGRNTVRMGGRVGRRHGGGPVEDPGS